MFDAFRGSENPATPVNSIYGNFLKSHGGTIIGTYGYGVSPLSEEEAIGAAESFQRAGGKIGVEDTSVPFGGVDFTSEALIAKQEPRERHPSDDGRRLELRSHDGARASGREAQGGSVVGGLRAGRHQLTRMVEPPGGVLLVPGPSLLIAQRGHRADGRRPHEVCSTSPRASSPVTARICRGSVATS